MEYGMVLLKYLDSEIDRAGEAIDTLTKSRLQMQQQGGEKRPLARVVPMKVQVMTRHTKRTKFQNTTAEYNAMRKSIPLYNLEVKPVKSASSVRQHQDERAAKVRAFAKKHLWLHSPAPADQTNRSDPYSGKYKCTKCSRNFKCPILAVSPQLVCGAAKNSDYPDQSQRKKITKQLQR